LYYVCNNHVFMLALTSVDVVQHVAQMTSNWLK